MDPPLLILDEPTSSVDAPKDEQILTAIDTLTQNRTVFMIAHRLWTLKTADKILVLKGGQISQYGTHEELLDQPDVDGGLIGGASLKADDFAAIVKAASR